MDFFDAKAAAKNAHPQSQNDNPVPSPAPNKGNHKRDDPTPWQFAPPEITDDGWIRTQHQPPAINGPQLQLPCASVRHDAPFSREYWRIPPPTVPGRRAGHAHATLRLPPYRAHPPPISRQHWRQQQRHSTLFPSFTQQYFRRSLPPAAGKAAKLSRQMIKRKLILRSRLPRQRKAKDFPVFCFSRPAMPGRPFFQTGDETTVKIADMQTASHRTLPSPHAQ